MKLLSTRSARAVWLFHFADLNPGGLAVWQPIVEGLTARYGFVVAPDFKEIVENRLKNQPKSWAFSAGVFVSQDRGPCEVTLTVHRDGVWADTQASTSVCDEFIADVLNWLSSDFGLADYKTLSIKKMYVSEMIVGFDRSLSFINPALERFNKLLGEKVSTPIKSPRYDVGSLGFWIDPEQKPGHVNFRIEREEGVPFSENRYYSVAPLSTDTHLEMLNGLEQILSGKQR